MKELAKKVLRRLAAGVTCKNQTTFLYSHDLREITPVTTDPSLVIRPLVISEVEILNNVGFVSVTEASGRMLRGDSCFIACLDGRLAHYAWVQRSGHHPIESAGQNCEVLPGQIWIYHCRTAEWARGRRIYPAVLSHILNTSRQEGDALAWIYTTEDNIASQKGLERAGFVRRARLRSFSLGTWTLPLSPGFSAEEVTGQA